MAAEKKARAGAPDIVLDTKCLEFRQAQRKDDPDYTSDSEDSGDDKAGEDDLERTNLHGTAFRLGPLNYGKAREIATAIYDEKKKKKAEEKEASKAKKAARKETEAVEHQVNAREGAQRLWDNKAKIMEVWRMASCIVACCKLSICWHCSF